MDGVQVGALLFLVVMVAFLVHGFVTEKKDKELDSERWRAQRRLGSLDELRTLEILWRDTFDDPERRDEYERQVQEWYQQNRWALGLDLEEAAWVLRQGREHEHPPRWRAEIEAKREVQDNVALLIDSDGRTRPAEGRLTPQEWEEQMGWGEKHRITPEEVTALERQHGSLRTKDVMETLRQRFAAGDDAAWVEQVGPTLGQRDVAALLDVSESDVADDRTLLHLPAGMGKTVFPAFLFTDNGRVVDGIREVVAILNSVATPRFIVGWLTSLEPRLVSGAPAGQLGQHAVPINRLRAKDVDPVLQAAQQMADRLARRD